MTPSAESADAVSAKTFVPAEVLRDDEVILLAVKPSGWFVVLTSWSVLVAAGLVAAVARVAGSALGPAAAGSGLYLLCLAAAMLRLVVGCFQWLGRVYVLTDKRVMRIRGVIKVDVVQCALKQVTRTALTATRGEKIFGLGSLFFEVEGVEACEAGWINISRPEEVRRVVEEAIRRSRLRPGGGQVPIAGGSSP
ncbi:MAG TPA: PH domain-containing protein [Phycisphaerae bacterium]|nr:PH domain-containing protein [Phycisphaerae bacterium]